MLTGRVKSTLKKRILISFLDLSGFFALSIIFIIIFSLFKMMQFAPFSFVLSFFVYYGVIPRVSEGYTLFGYLFNLKIVSLSSDSISLLKYILRALYATLTPFFTLFYTHVKTNENGQLFYDKAFKTNVVPMSFESIDDYEISSNGSKCTYYFAAEHAKYLLYIIVLMLTANLITYFMH